MKQWELFTIRYGRLPPRLQQNTLQQLVDKCLRKVQYCISTSCCQTVNNFILLNNNVSLQKSENVTCADFLSRSAYDGGKSSKFKAIVELKSSWIVDEKAEPQNQYKALFESSHLGCNLHTNTKHFQDFTYVKGFEDVTEGLSFVCPQRFLSLWRTGFLPRCMTGNGIFRHKLVSGLRLFWIHCYAISTAVSFIWRQPPL